MVRIHWPIEDFCCSHPPIYSGTNSGKLRLTSRIEGFWMYIPIQTNASIYTKHPQISQRLATKIIGFKMLHGLLGKAHGRNQNIRTRSGMVLYLHWGVSKNRGTPKWMVYNGKPYKNGWFGGTTIFGNTHMVLYLHWVFGDVETSWDVSPNR